MWKGWEAGSGLMGIRQRQVMESCASRWKLQPLSNRLGLCVEQRPYELRWLCFPSHITLWEWGVYQLYVSVQLEKQNQLEVICIKKCIVKHWIMWLGRLSGESEICQGDLQERQTRIVRDELMLGLSVEFLLSQSSSVLKTFKLIDSCTPRLSRKPLLAKSASYRF